MFAGAVAALCAAAMATLMTWPPTDSITWRPLTPPSWWQIEWLAGLGFWLSALPSFVIFEFDAFFSANEHLRDPVVDLLLLVEILALCICVYKIVVVFDTHSAKAIES